MDGGCFGGAWVCDRGDENGTITSSKLQPVVVSRVGAFLSNLGDEREDSFSSANGATASMILC